MFYLGCLYSQVHFLVADVWPELDALQPDLVDITLHGIYRDLQEKFWEQL